MNPKIILASQSPRRREILNFLGIPFEHLALDIDETPNPNLHALEQPEHLARAKAQYAMEKYPDRKLPFLCADTLVIHQDQVLGKALNRSHARSMLQSLQNTRHKVRTGIALLSPAGEIISDVAETEVQFRKQSLIQINAYLDTLEYSDKAGAYGIQGYGARLVEEIHGCYFNVMGLPVQATLKLLKDYL